MLDLERPARTYAGTFLHSAEQDPEEKGSEKMSPWISQFFIDIVILIDLAWLISRTK